MTTTPLLVVQGMTKRFGGLAAVDDVSFEMHDGDILGLIGPNGAGKTTLFNLISGFTPPSAGSVLWQGRDITRLPAATRAHLGLVRTFQVARVFGQLTVRENLLAACHTATTSTIMGDLLGTRRSRRTDRLASERADEVIERFGFGPLATRIAHDLPYGLTKRLGLLIGVTARPKLLMLDEPAAGLNHEEIDVLRSDLTALPAEGMTVLLVEHHMGLVMTVSDSVIVLDAGKKIAEGTPAEVSAEQTVIDAYLGA